MRHELAAATPGTNLENSPVHADQRAVHTPSAGQVRRPINRDGVETWRNYECSLAPLRGALGAAIERWTE